MNDWKDQARTCFHQFSEIPEEEWQYAVKKLQVRHYKKNEHLLEAGTVANSSFLILKGIVRIYYLTESGKEFNRGFASENHFCGSVGSIIAGLPSRFFIQALEDVESVLLLRSDVNKLYDRHRCWDRLGRVIAESAMIHYEIKEGEFLESLEERYLRLEKEQPELFHRIPQYHIASYLGITHVALSRIRKRLRESEPSPFELDER